MSGIFTRSSVNTPSSKYDFKNIFGKQTKKDWDMSVKKLFLQYSPWPAAGRSETGQGDVRTAIPRLLVNELQYKASGTVVKIDQIKAYIRNRNISEN